MKVEKRKGVETKLGDRPTTEVLSSEVQVINFVTCLTHGGMRRANLDSCALMLSAPEEDQGYHPPGDISEQLGAGQ